MSKDYRASTKIPHNEKNEDTVKKEAVLFEPPYFEYGWRENYFASQESSFGPQVMWVKIDSAPFVTDEEGNYVQTNEYSKYPILYGIHDGTDMFLTIDSYYGPLYYKQDWLTRDFWNTKHWNETLEAVSMTKGKDFLYEALALPSLNTVSSVVDEEMMHCKEKIENETGISLTPLDSVSGEQMKKVLVYFEQTMHEKYRN